jgi:hypothetical protein
MGAALTLGVVGEHLALDLTRLEQSMAGTTEVRLVATPGVDQ